MNKLKLGSAIAISAALVVGCNQGGGGGSLSIAEGLPKSEQEKYSYGLGQNMAGSLVDSGVELDTAYFNAGFYDAYNGNDPMMTPRDIREAMGALQVLVQEKQTQEREKVASGNQQAADDFLAENASADGVVVTESGLQYKIVEQGEGAIPTATDTVSVHYEGRLIDGTVFDSSYERGQPASFPVQGVISGWTEALQLMPTGSKWQLVIPPELGYGVSGAGGQIGPNAALVFDVELLSVEGGEDEQPSAE